MEDIKRNSVIIVAGGKGLRAGGDIPKQFQLVGGIPILMRTINVFYQYDNDIEIVVVLPEGYDQYWSDICITNNFIKPHKITTGGVTRFESVRNGLQLVENDGIVAVHDAARPFVPISVIERCYKEAKVFHCGIIPVIEEKNSIRVIKGYESEPFDRSKIRIVQTPQVFPLSTLKNAYNAPYDEKFTDDASVADADGVQIKLVQGDERNIKITTPFDFKIAEFLAYN